MLVVLILVSLYIRGAFRRRVRYRVKNTPSPNEARFPDILTSISNSLSTSGYTTGFWSTPAQIQQARLDAIQKAQRSIHFETFFMTPGKRANDFAAAVAERAAAGVEVLLLVDSYGSHTLSSKYWKRLRAAGVQVKFFNPFDWRAPANYAGRTHRKLLLVDGEIALTGGAGISDLWDGTEKSDDTQPWFDIELRLEGKIVSILEGIFQQHWIYEGGIADFRAEVLPPKQEEAVASAFPIVVTAGSNPTYRFSPIRALKQTSLACARQRIWLASPYFLPDRNSRQLLIQAKQQGLDVRILTTSRRSDKKFVYYASYEVCGELLAGGVEIYEYQPSMTHAKMLLIDDYWVNVGSANYDYRSFLHNDELDLSTNEPTLMQQVKQTFEKGFAQSQQISLKQWQQRSIFKHRIVGNIVRLVQWQL
ncbi:MAG: phosphatidylserine/phosphatidylglycerophosphate/c ardiolipin synthase family protein [Elainellaceae cyanobacterium]